MSNDTQTSFLFHVTFYRRLESIADDGLVAGRARSIGGVALDNHAQKGVFLTSADGVPFWHHRAEEWAEHGSDDVLEDGLVPVVLRMDEAIFEEGELHEDLVGTSDAKHDAWIARLTIPPGELEVYDGEGWIALDEWNALDPALAVEVIETDEETGQEIHQFVESSPLLPAGSALSASSDPQ